LPGQLVGQRGFGCDVFGEVALLGILMRSVIGWVFGVAVEVVPVQVDLFELFRQDFNRGLIRQRRVIGGSIGLCWFFSRYVLFLLALVYTLAGVLARLTFVLRRPSLPPPPPQDEASHA